MNLKSFALTALCYCAAASAQMPTSMSEKDMQQMMAAMQEVQACFQTIDQGKVKALEKRSKQFSAEIESLCKSGKRSQAETRAMDFYHEMMADDTVQKAKACSEKIPASLKSMTKAPIDYSQYAEENKQHVCD